MEAHEQESASNGGKASRFGRLVTARMQIQARCCFLSSIFETKVFSLSFRERESWLG
jgi:hypothetical protein